MISRNIQTLKKNNPTHVLKLARAAEIPPRVLKELAELNLWTISDCIWGGKDDSRGPEGVEKGKYNTYLKERAERGSGD